jgi:di/tricarboxylate transporter
LLAFSPLYINKKSRFRTGVPMTRYYWASWIRIFPLLWHYSAIK